MKKIRNYFDWINVAKYTLYLFLFILLNNVEKQIYPYSVSLFSVLIFHGNSYVVTPFLLLSSFLVCKNTGLLLSVAISIAVILITQFIYGHFKTNMRFESAVFCLLSLSGFILIGDTNTYVPLEQRLFCCGLTTLMQYLFNVSYNSLVKNGIKYKHNVLELACICLSVIVFGTGLSNALSPYVFKTVSIFAVLSVFYLCDFSIGLLCSTVFGIGFAIYYGNINYVSIYAVYGISCGCFMNFSHRLSALSLVVCEYLISAMFGAYKGLVLYNVLSCGIGAFLFSAIPNKPMETVKEKFDIFRQNQIVRQTINNNRIFLSNRLYELSNVFCEMAFAFNKFSSETIDEERAKSVMLKQIYSETCCSCDCRRKCKIEEKTLCQALSTVIGIGFAKGKVSFIDLPKELTSYCLKPNGILFGINKMLGEYRSCLLEKENLKTSRDLIAKEAYGVSEMLKTLALDSGAMLKFQNKTEQTLYNELLRSGFNVSELLIYGDSDDVKVSIVLKMKEFALSTLSNVISDTLETNMILYDKNDISDDKVYLSFKKSAPFDAIFGVYSTVKDGSKISGDTHSVTRISDDKFLVALSDGMGSGQKAQEISSLSLSLIESFYKAGLKSNLILNTVNKLLAINSEDLFTALDIFIVDLKNCTADFIKYGCPYGFIIGESGIKIIEGNSLPLGILEELKPSVCSSQINSGDIILLVSDGVSDAFGSSADIIEFLRKQPAKNPQSVCENIVNKAVSIQSGKKNDDMTAVAVRIFSKDNLLKTMQPA